MGVAIGTGDDLIRDAFAFLFHFAEFATHEALDRINRVAGVCHRLAFCGIADQPFTGLAEGHY